MDILTPDELDQLINNSDMYRKYNQTVDRESAYEILMGKITSTQTAEAEPESKPEKKAKAEKEEGSVIGEALDSTVGRQVARTIAREVTRGLLGVLGLGGSSSRKKKSWF